MKYNSKSCRAARLPGAVLPRTVIGTKSLAASSLGIGHQPYFLASHQNYHDHQVAEYCPCFRANPAQSHETGRYLHL